MLGITVIEALVFSELWEYACMLVIIISFVILKLIALIENENKLLFELFYYSGYFINNVYRSIY